MMDCAGAVTGWAIAQVFTPSGTNEDLISLDETGSNVVLLAQNNRLIRTCIAKSNYFQTVDDKIPKVVIVIYQYIFYHEILICVFALALSQRDLLLFSSNQDGTNKYYQIDYKLRFMFLKFVYFIINKHMVFFSLQVNSSLR